MKLLLCLLSVYIIRTDGLSSHWTRVLPKICSNNTPKNIHNAIIGCDRLMNTEVKNIFDNCVKKINKIDPNDGRPKICHYSNRAQQLDNCKSSRYRERNYNMTQIIAKEQKHTWCLMKIARPLGWEQLCASNLSQNKRTAINRCENSFKEITDPIKQCFGKVVNKPNDGRPSVCHSFEYSTDLWQCLESYSNNKNNEKRNKELEEMSDQYMNCLKNIDQKSK